jgi:hypothetical protein
MDNNEAGSKRATACDCEQNAIIAARAPGCRILCACGWWRSGRPVGRPEARERAPSGVPVHDQSAAVPRSC